MTTKTDGQGFLRFSLKANAVFSAGSGALLALIPGVVAGWIGVDTGGVLRVLGFGLLLFAAHLVYVGTRPVVNRRSVGAIVVSDLIWVAGSAALVFGFPELLNAAGRVIVIAVAGAVLILADLQAWGLWRSRQNLRT